MNRTLALSLSILAGLPAAGVMGCTASTPAGTMTVQQPPPPPPPPPQPMQQPMATAPAMIQPTASVGSGSAGSMVTQTWTATGYNVSDFVSNHMTLRARQFANGFIAVTDLVRGIMRHGERRTVVAAVVGGHCYRIIGVGGAGVQDLDLYLRDLTGNVIDRTYKSGEKLGVIYGTKWVRSFEQLKENPANASARPSQLAGDGWPGTCTPTDPVR